MATTEQQEDFLDAIATDPDMAPENVQHWTDAAARDYLHRAERAEARLAALEASARTFVDASRLYQATRTRYLLRGEKEPYAKADTANFTARNALAALLDAPAHDEGVSDDSHV